MPRAGWRKPETERRLSDLVSVGVLTRVFPPELVDEVIAAAGRTEQRHRSGTGHGDLVIATALAALRTNPNMPVPIEEAVSPAP